MSEIIAGYFTINLNCFMSQRGGFVLCLILTLQLKLSPSHSIDILTYSPVNKDYIFCNEFSLYDNAPIPFHPFINDYWTKVSNIRFQP